MDSKCIPLSNKLYRVNLCFCIFLFLLHALVAIQNRNVYLSDDEMGVLAAAAYFAGENWSSLVQTIPYYGYGQALLYVPIFIFTHSPTGRLIGMGLINSALMTLIYPVSFRICYRYLNCTEWKSMKYAAVSALFPSYMVYSKWLWNETMLNLLPWLIFLALLYLNAAETIWKRILGSTWLSFLIFYSFAVHERAIVFIIAVFTVIFLITFMTGRLLVEPVSFLTSCVIFNFARKSIKQLLLQNLWLLDTGENITNTVSDVFQHWAKICIEDIPEILLQFASSIYSSTMASFGLSIVFGAFLIYASVCFYRRNLKLRSTFSNRASRSWLISVSFVALMFWGALGASALAVKASGDYILYTRYYSNTLGLIFPLTIMLWDDYADFRKISFFLYPIILGVSGLSLLLFDRFSYDGHVRSFIMINIAPFLGSDGGQFIQLNFLICFIAWAIIIAAYYGKMRILFGTLLSVFFFSYYSCVKNIVLPSYIVSAAWTQPVVDFISSVYALDEHFPHVYFCDFNWSNSQLQFALPNLSIEPVNEHQYATCSIQKDSIVVSRYNLNLEQYSPNYHRLLSPLNNDGSMYAWSYGENVTSYIAENSNILTDAPDQITLFKRMKTNNGITDETGALRSNGEKGFFLYGPYMSLQPGDYHISFIGQVIKGEMESVGWVDVTHSSGKFGVVEKTPLSTLVDETGKHFDLYFSVEEAIDGFEFRVYVNEGTEIMVTDIVLEHIH